MSLGKFFLFLSALLLGPSAHAIDDYPGSKDHPVISRYPGFAIVYYDEKQFDEYHLIAGPVQSGMNLKDVKHIRLEGKVTRIRYQGPKNRSTLEVYKNYEHGLKKAGFEIIYNGRGNEIRGIYSVLEKANRDLLGGLGRSRHKAVVLYCCQVSKQ